MARLSSRALGRGGSALPGKVLLALYPDALRRLGRSVGGRVVLVSATNGKTTTAAMLATICEQAGLRLAHNVTGANLRSGLATTLLLAERERPDVVLLETDEATLPLVAADLDPAVIVLGNLFRDQLDRYGELETLADRWRDALQGLSIDTTRATIAYNADDPLIAELTDALVADFGGPGADLVLAFGIEDAAVGVPELPHAADSKFCRRCGTALTYRHSYVGHLGDYRCPSCGFARPAPQVAATSVGLEGLGATRLELRLGTGAHATIIDARLRIPGLYNAYNALAAAAAAAALGLPARHVEAGLAAFSPAFGRFERVPVPGGGTLTFLLVKNPTGLNEVIRTVTASGVDLAACLFALNDGIADGRDTSWIWDADVEPLLAATPGLIVTGDRAAEFALRCVYGGADAAALDVVEDVEEALDRLIARAREYESRTHNHAYALVTYTAMLRMRAIVAERGWVSEFWRERAQPPVAGVRP